MAIKNNVIKAKYVKFFAVCWLLIYMVTPAAKAEDYNIIIEKNIFSPTRQKWVTPPKVQPKKEINKALLPQLNGTIVSDDRKMAILSFHQPPAPTPARTRRRRRGKKGKSAPVVTPRMNDSRILSVGDRFGDFRLVAIEDKQVTLECEGQKIKLATQR